MWLTSSEVDFPTSDDFYFFTIRKRSVRRVFIAIKRRWGVPAHPSTNHDLKRSWAKKQILDKSILLVSLSSSEVDFPTSDAIFVYTILKRRVRRVFKAIKLRWGVPASPSTNHGLKRSWAKNLESKLDSSGLHFFCSWPLQFMVRWGGCRYSPPELDSLKNAPDSPL